MRWQAKEITPMLGARSLWSARLLALGVCSVALKCPLGARQDESAVTADPGPQVPNVYHEVKKQKPRSWESPATLCRTEAQATAAEPWDAATSAAAPSPKDAPSLCGRLLPPQQLAEGNLQLSCFSGEVCLS